MRPMNWPYLQFTIPFLNRKTIRTQLFKKTDQVLIDFFIYDETATVEVLDFLIRTYFFMFGIKKIYQFSVHVSIYGILISNWSTNAKLFFLINCVCQHLANLVQSKIKKVLPLSENRAIV